VTGVRPVFSLHVAGTPRPQGSKRAFPVQRGGKPGAVLVDANPSTAQWRADVTAAALALPGMPPSEPVTGPLAVRLVFALPRPRSAPRKRRTWPAGRPDIDKLARAVLDSLTAAGVWRDDGQVCALHVIKDYPGPGVAQTIPGVLITVTHIEEGH